MQLEIVFIIFSLLHLQQISSKTSPNGCNVVAVRRAPDNFAKAHRSCVPPSPNREIRHGESLQYEFVIFMDAIMATIENPGEDWLMVQADM